MRKVLITGITGFVGSHLADYLLSTNEYQIYGIKRWRSKLSNIRHIYSKLHMIDGDITDLNSIGKILREVKPDIIFHLAAQSFVLASWNAPAQTLNNNIIGTNNLLEAVRSSNIDPKIQIAGSSEEYGIVYPEENPITEKNHLRPMSPYGVSKVATDLLAIQYNKSYGLKTIVTRAFNHSGPRRGDVFVCSNFAKQIVEGSNGLLKVGNLDNKRDFTDVRDIVKAYTLAIDKCRPGEQYNICTGNSWKIKDILDLLIKISGKQIKTELDPERLRPSDVPILEGDYTKFREATGWSPSIPFENTMKDLLTYWEKGGVWTPTDRQL